MSADDKPRREERSHGEDYPAAVDADTPEDHYAAPTPTTEPEREAGSGPGKRRTGRGGIRSVGDVAARFGPDVGPDQRDR
jgi:hypothetical protein